MGNVERICAKPSTLERLRESDWIVVGNLLGGLGSFAPEEAGDAYKVYVDCSRDPDTFETVDEFGKAMVGWTLIEISRIDVPLLFSVHYNIAALVPHNLLERSDFDVGIPGVWMGYGSLIVARWTPDHVFVIADILCEKSENYRECAAQYERGLFDAATGLEHSGDGKPKKGAARIDTTTFRRLE